MNIQEYLSYYADLQDSIKKDEALLSLLKSKGYRSLISRLIGKDSFSSKERQIICQNVFDEERLKKCIKRKTALYEKATYKITTAASGFKNKALRDYVINRYVYGFTHEEVAEMCYYSERQLYRLAKSAKAELYKALLLLMPKANLQKMC